MEMPDNHFFANTLVTYVNNGTIPESRIDDMGMTFIKPLISSHHLILQLRESWLVGTSSIKTHQAFQR
jgi:hypothetical protein